MFLCEENMIYNIWTRDMKLVAFFICFLAISSKNIGDLVGEGGEQDPN